MNEPKVANFEVICMTCKRFLEPEPEWYNPAENLTVRLVCPECKAKVRIIVQG